MRALLCPLSPVLPTPDQVRGKRRPSGGARRRNGPSASSGRTAEKGGNGFTLVEMLIALSIFAAIAAMGVRLLRSRVDTQDAGKARPKEMGRIKRLRACRAENGHAGKKGCW